MKVLYAIQGTGNGHLSRAIEIVPILSKKVSVDVLLSGIQCELSLPFPVKYRLRGMSFIFGKKGGVDLLRTYLKTNTLKFATEIWNLPIQEYDLVVNDFEPVSAWAAKFKDVPCVSLSNQCAVLSPFAPKPEKTDHLGKFILEHYAPTNKSYGFHFKSFGDRIYTPVIRKEVREIKIIDKGHYTVYLPAHEDEKIIRHLRKFRKIKWEVFSKHCKSRAYSVGNMQIQPIQNEAFLKSMASSTGVLCAAGFGTASEALYLGKKLLVIPMKTQYEQQCNAAVLKSMGVPVLKKLKKKHLEKLEDWLANGKPVEVHYPDRTEEIIDAILADQVKENSKILRKIA